MDKFCPGRDSFEELVPFGSEVNKCLFGMRKGCTECNFYRSKTEETK